MDVRGETHHPELGESRSLAVKRVRLLAALTLLGGVGLVLAIPFALRAGAEFFMPVTAALVVAIALVPMLQWFEKHGIPARIASFLCVLIFLVGVVFALAAIVIPALDWITLFPERVGRIKSALDPVLRFYTDLQAFIDRTLGEVASAVPSRQTVQIEQPNSMLDLIASSAPHLAVQLFFALLLIFFFLAGWTAMRKRTIVARGSFEGQMTTARVIHDVVDATSTYIATITVINITLGVITGLVVWFLGMPTPLMWGGLVALFNFIPYLGPAASVLLLFVGGLMSYPDPWAAILPPAIFFAIHTIEANVITPSVVGRRIEVNPLMILVALSFWAWVWGTVGALLAVPLLIIIKTVFAAAGTPDIAGFLFEDGTLTHVGDEEDEKDD